MFTSAFGDIHCDLHASKSVLAQPPIAIGVQKNSEYLEVVKHAADTVIGTGHMNKIMQYNAYALKLKESCETNPTPQITFNTVSSIFIFLLFFIGLSSLVVTIECLLVLKRGKLLS